MVNFEQSVASIREAFRNVAGVLRPARSRRRRNSRPAAEVLEQRTLLSVANFIVEPSTQDDHTAFRFQWTDNAATTETTYEFWVDEVLPEGRRNSRVYYERDIAADALREGSTNSMQYLSSVEYPSGNYIGYIRSHDADGPNFWYRHSFQIDDDSDPATPLNAIDKPTAPEITVLREGQGWLGQSSSESSIGWTSESVLHDIWLNRRTESGPWQRYRLIRNVTGSSISFSQLAAADKDGWATYFGQIDASASDMLETGDYRIFIRSVNRSADASGQWDGTSLWSIPVDFSYQRVEGADAKPDTLTATNELRTSIEWSPVNGAEQYLVSIWKGPDYSANRPMFLRTNATQLKPTNLQFDDGNETIAIKPGDEFFIKVRGIGQDGSPVSFQPGNFASTTIRIPEASSVSTLPAPMILGPDSTIGNPQPLLRWEELGNAQNYEVWISSLLTGQRVLLAENVPGPYLRLNDDALSRYVSAAVDESMYSATEGLVAGRYRFWVRAHSSIAANRSPWSSGQEFEVSQTADDIFDLNGELATADRQVISPNRIVSHQEPGRDFVLIATGKGESFGRSVLAKYEVGDDGIPSRPVITDTDGTQQLEFADLPMGSNVTDMQVLSDGRVVVLSRGSNEVRLIDPVAWEVQSTYSLLPGRDVIAPDPIGLEVLSNDQILVVFNRSHRLRILEAGSQQLTEVNLRDGASGPDGFVLEHGRAVHVSAVDQGNNRYRIFASTSGIHAVTAYDYHVERRTLTVVNTDDNEPFKAVRSESSNPFLGGTTIDLQMPSGEVRPVFVSADRSGFLTWVDSVSLQFGFIDMADWMPWASRDPASDIYVNPDDNSYDTTSIISFGNQQLAVFSNRANSLLIQLQMSASGQVSVVDGSASDLFRGTSGTVLPTANGHQLFVTGTAPVISEVSQGVEGRQLTTTALNRIDGQTYYAVGVSTEIVVSNPVKKAHAVGDRLLFQSADSKWKLLTPPGASGEWHSVTWPSTLPWQDRELTMSTGFDAVWQDTSTGEFFVALSVDDPAEDNHRIPVVAIARLNDELLPEVISVHVLPELEQITSASFSNDHLLLVDRRHGESMTIHHWRSPGQERFEEYSFAETRESEFGRIRPGHAIRLNDHSTAYVHDTFPDRGVSVVSDRSRSAPVFHPNTTGTFAFDLHRYDDERILMATYGGDLVIQNATTGVVELDLSLNDFAGTDITLSAVENSSYENGILSVVSPANQMAAVFEVVQVNGQWQVTPLEVYATPDIVRTIIHDGSLWIVETSQIRRVELLSVR